MRFLVLGASGMAGHMICSYLSEVGHDVTGVSRRHCPISSIRHVKANALDFSFLTGMIAGGNFDAIVNCIGILNSDCDKSPTLAIRANAELPHVIVDAARSIGTLVVQISTDCVFAGNTGPYTDSSLPDGSTLYDRTKALGEISGDGCLTLRQSIIGPDPNPEGIGLYNWFMNQDDCVKGYERCIWTGLTTLELAKAVEKCTEVKASGLFNMVPSSSGLSKFKLLEMFNELCRKRPIGIVPSDAIQIDKSLVPSSDMPYEPVGYHQQIEEMAAWISDHMSIYPHYRDR